MAPEQQFGPLHVQLVRASTGLDTDLTPLSPELRVLLAAEFLLLSLPGIWKPR